MNKLPRTRVGPNGRDCTIGRGGGNEAGEIDDETGKLCYFNKYLKGQTQTLEQGSKN
jgi:hypothetical protein